MTKWGGPKGSPLSSRETTMTIKDLETLATGMLVRKFTQHYENGHSFIIADTGKIAHEIALLMAGVLAAAHYTKTEG